MTRNEIVNFLSANIKLFLDKCYEFDVHDFFWFWQCYLGKKNDNNYYGTPPLDFMDDYQMAQSIVDYMKDEWGLDAIPLFKSDE